ncbi:MAG: sigma-54 dependent transcriptional regulator [Deltaproteobacteria bacterium]|nr:sigma-54 dependent transcriptional regulator [Deltaproteobacteria bacterium]
MSRPRILVADDNANLRRLVARVIGELGEVVEAATGSEAIARLAGEPFELVVTDVRMPGADGFAVLEAAVAASPRPEVVMMTAYATVDRAVAAMKQGAFDYLQKPFDPDRAREVIEAALERRQQREDAGRGLGRLIDPSAPAGMIGRSEAMQEVFALIERAGGLDLTVLVTGESGTGKELVARAIHEASDRKGRPFVAVNCGALPAELVESELFGHLKGSFSGADRDRPGLFREADGGTLFLDEIGELPLSMQVKLNRVLEERKVRPVGATREAAVDVRVIAATLRSLPEEVAAGAFREDLFYRLNVFPIALPPLRERREDLPLLAAHFVATQAKVQGRTLRGLTPEALGLLAAWPFPGNVRELRNVIERTVATCEGDTIGVDDLPSGLREARPGLGPLEALAALPYKEAMRIAKVQGVRAYLDALLRRHEGNVSKAARAADIERESLHRLLKKHGLKAEDYRQL